MHACWRGYKSELKVKHFDWKSHDDAIEAKPNNMLAQTWNKEFWKFKKGKVIVSTVT